VSRYAERSRARVAANKRAARRHALATAVIVTAAWSGLAAGAFLLALCWPFLMLAGAR
jgi:hypothetical protein